jgi:hypothetical protein
VCWRSEGSHEEHVTVEHINWESYEHSAEVLSTSFKKYKLPGSYLKVCNTDWLITSQSCCTYPLPQVHLTYSAVAFYVRTYSWRSCIIQGKFSHGNKFALFQICIIQICIKCDGTLHDISGLSSSLQMIMVVIILTDILDH